MVDYLIEEGMDVVGSCGGRLGTVEALEGCSIRLAPGDLDGRRYLPLEWVDCVRGQVHLTITCAQAREELCAAPVAAWV